MLATDIKSVRDNPKLKLISAVELGYQGITMNLANGPKADTPLAKDARVRRPSSSPRPRRHQSGRVQRRVRAGQPVDQPDNPYYQQAFPVPKRDLAKAKALLKEAGVTTPIALDFMVPNGPENRAVAEVVQSMAAEAGFDLKIRVTEFATSLKQGEDGDYQLYLIGWSGRSDPDGNSYVFQTCSAPQNNGRYCDKEVDAARRRRALRAIRPSARRSTRTSPRNTSPTARSSTSTIAGSWWRSPTRSRATSRCPTGWCAWSA